MSTRLERQKNKIDRSYDRLRKGNKKIKIQSDGVLQVEDKRAERNTRSLFRGLSILLIFSKTQLFLSLIFQLFLFSI